MNNETFGNVSPAALREQLRAELSREHPDRPTVSRLWEALRQQTAAEPDPVTPEARQKLDVLWQDYKATRDGTNTGKKISRSIYIKLSAAAAVLALVLCAAPIVAGSSALHEVFGSWCEKTFSFLNATEPTETQQPHVFETDHSGLRQIYDAATQLGITAPVIPAWVPEGYELTQLDQSWTPNGVSIYALLECDDSSIALMLHLNSQKDCYSYFKDSAKVEMLEYAGILHFILRNEQQTSVLWITDDLECVLSVCGGDVDIRQILLSIYKGVN